METRMIILMIIIPLFSALIGWFTNFIAIKSLFKPVHKKNILGFNIQGVIPKRKKKLAINVAEAVEEYLFSHKDILEELEKKENIAKIKKKLVPILEEKIVEKIPDMFKMVAKPIISQILKNEIDGLIVKLNQEIATSVLENIDVKKTIAKKLNEYDVSNIEKIIYKIASKELKHIELLGAVIGFVVGLVQVGIMVGLV